MSITLRGILKAAWEYNPIMLPFTLARKAAESDAAKKAAYMVKDGLEVAAETTVRAANDLNKKANHVLDYPIEEGVAQAGQAIEQGAVLTGYAIQKGVVEPTARRVNAAADAVEYAYDGAVQGTAEAIIAADQAVDRTVQGAKRTVINTGEAIVETHLAAVDAADQAQRKARKGLAEWISPE